MLFRAVWVLWVSCTLYFSVSIGCTLMVRQHGLWTYGPGIFYPFSVPSVDTHWVESEFKNRHLLITMAFLELFCL